MPTKVQEDAVTLEKTQLMKVLLGREEKDDVLSPSIPLCCLLSHVALGLVLLCMQLKV